MVAIKIDNFQGKTPRTSPELLDNTKAQIANNLKLYSGDLLPYRIPRAEYEVATSPTVKSVYGLYDDNDDIVWLSWGVDVDVVLRSDIDDASDDNVLDRRFFYTGDGYPKQSWFELAINGSEPYPNAYYRLGLPLPTVKPTTAVTSFSELSSADIGRDGGSQARIRFTTPHNLRDGNVISVTGFTLTYTSLNTENIEVTIIDDDEISYFSRGDAIPFGTSNSDGRVNLAGGNTIRSYVYTWLSPFGAESVPSPPSKDDYLREGQTVTVGNLPQTGPGDNYLVAGIGIYRTVVTANGSDYFLLKRLFFPGTTATVARLGEVSTVRTEEFHNLQKGDRFKLDGCTDASFDIVDGVVTKVVDRYTFEYDQPLQPDVLEVADTTGTLYHDVAELLTDTSIYWGDPTYNNFDFVDDFESRNLSTSLTSLFYDPPPDGMKGLIMGPNNIACGFVGNQLCLSEPLQIHAWPERYRITFEYEVVAVAVVMGTIIVLTEGYPYRIDGGFPDTMSWSRIDALFPCVSKRSTVAMDYGVVYASHSGLVMYSPNSGIRTVTKLIHDWDTWENEINYEDIVAGSYQNRYLASYGTGSFIYERSDETEGVYVDIPTRFDAVWVDRLENSAYIIDQGTNAIFEWDNNDYPFAFMDWKSKVYILPDYVNLGAARVIADYDDTGFGESIDAYNQLVAERNEQTIAELSAIGIDYLGTYNAFVFGGGMFNGDPYLEQQFDTITPPTVQFRLWANKELVFETILTDGSIFRMPTGYRTDTYEVAVTGPVRVRAIHLAETPLGLKQI
jgi:hypothetical protein